MLFNNDIFESKNIFIHIDQKKITINNCDNFSTSLKIVIKNNNKRIKRIIKSQTKINILIYFCIIVLIKYCNNKLLNRNIIFNFNNIKRLNKKTTFFRTLSMSIFLLFKYKILLTS